MKPGFSDYKKIMALVSDLYMDYGFKSFPINEKHVCKKLGIKLIPYSEFDLEAQQLFKKASQDAFFIPASINNPNLILYEDRIASEGRKRFSIFHEIKHFVNGDAENNQYNEDLANYFAKYFMCPTPYLIAKNITDRYTICSEFNVSMEVAGYIEDNINKRISRYGNTIFDSEKALIRHLLGDEYIEGGEAKCA